MTADVCDLDEFNTGQRREGILGAVYWWMVKFGNAFAGLLGGLILWTVGFDPEAASESAIYGLRFAYTVLPIAGVVGAIMIMWNYDITEAKADEIRKKLEQRRSENQKVTA